MTTIKLDSGIEVKFYSSIKEMPVQLYNMMQGYLLQDVGVGSTMEDVMRHFQNLDVLIAQGKIEEAVTERRNLHYNMYIMLEGLSFTSMSFACLVYSIDNVKTEDRSEEALHALVQKLSEVGLTAGMVEEQLEDLKKNFRPN